MRLSIDSDELREAIIMYMECKAGIPREQIGDIIIETADMTSCNIDYITSVSFEKGE